MTLTGTEAYYARRANEFDTVYEKPERQADLQTMASRLAETFAGLDVLEVAAGTGYWTQFFGDRARSVVATDINDAVLEVARNRQSWKRSIRFVEANAFALDEVPGTFNGAFVGFLWSHLPLDQLDNFINHLHLRLEPSSRVVFVDSRHVDRSNNPITRPDRAGNTYQARSLEDGSKWEVLKNFPTVEEVRARLDPIAARIEVVELEYFWIADISTSGA